MNTRSLALALSGFILHTTALEAQLGHFPVLAPFKSDRGECRFGNPNATLGRAGVMRVAVFLPEKPDRRVSVATDASGNVMMVSAYYHKTVSKKRVEQEVITALFAADGRLRRGSRAFRVSKQPPSSAEDREQLLSATDAEAAMKLGQFVAQRCPVPKSGAR